MMNSKLLLCLFSSLSNAFIFAPDKDGLFDTEFKTKLRSFINISMECHHIPGMTLAVVKGEFQFSRRIRKQRKRLVGPAKASYQLGFVCFLVSFCCMQDVSLVHCAFAVIISTYEKCQMALCPLGGQSLLIPGAQKRFCHTYNMKLKICLLLSSSSVIQINCFSFCHLPKPVTLFLKDAHCYTVGV